MDIVEQVLSAPSAPAKPIDELLDSMQELMRCVRVVQLKTKQVEKENTRLTKEVQRLKNERRRKQLSGFVKPVKVADELCEMLELPRGIVRPRMDIVKLLYEYIKEHKLQDPVDGRIIKPNETMARVLRVQNGEKVTYFNIQTKLKHLFIAV